jgi:hypothetical protein
MSKWYVKADYSGKYVVYQLRTGLDGVVAETQYAEDAKQYERIAACVNACEGLDPEGIRGLMEAAKNYVNVVEIESHTISFPQYLVKYREALDIWRSALAAVKEEGE